MLAATAPSFAANFLSDSLPRLLAGVASGWDRLSAAHQLGAAMAEALPFRRLELFVHGPEGDEGLLFLAPWDRALEPAFAIEVMAPDAGTEGRIGGRIYPPQAGIDEQACRSLLLLLLRLMELCPLQTPGDPLPPPTLDPPTVETYRQASTLARGEVSVLLRGATGSGKEVLARYLHEQSKHSAGPWVALNCAALPAGLLEAELFGTESQAATGVEARPGVFERAHGGTLLLDEIGEMAVATQAKLLRVLEAGEVLRLGGHRPRPAQARVVSATHRDFEELLLTGAFRTDLYHRLADAVLTLPPLAARRRDLVNFAAYFLGRELGRLGLPFAGIEASAAEALLACPWPGNVRQLEREMARAALFLAPGERLGKGHLSAAVLGEPSSQGRGTMKERLAAKEKEAIAQAVMAAGGDVPKAAKRLGLGRSTLYRRLQELGLATADHSASRAAGS